MTSALMKGEDGFSLSVQPGWCLALHFSQLGLVRGLWEKLCAGSRVRGKLSMWYLRLSLYNGKIIIVQMKYGLGRTLRG